MRGSIRILVTGGAGYIGSHTSKCLARAGHEPIVIDNLSTGHRNAVRWGAFIEGDLEDQETLNRAFREFSIGAVIHLAGSAYVGESMLDPAKYFRNNFVNTLNLLEAMRTHGVDKIVFSSSCATYGLPINPIIDECHSQHPVNPYGESKLMIERLLIWYGRTYGLKWIALRYFNAAGGDIEGELGELHDPEPHLIPRTILAGLGRLESVNIFGTTYATPDGTAIRDFIHVTDLADGHLRSLLHLSSGGASGPFNLGTGKGHSVREVIAAVERVMERAIPICESGCRPGDPATLVADSSQAQKVLGWVPKHSDLETIVQTALYWHSAPSRPG